MDIKERSFISVLAQVGKPIVLKHAAGHTKDHKTDEIEPNYSSTPTKAQIVDVSKDEREFLGTKIQTNEYLSFHIKNSLEVKIDDVIIYNSKKYVVVRVKRPGCKKIVLGKYDQGN